MIFKREPAFWAGAVSTVLTLIVAFGLDLSVEQTGAIVAAVQAVGAAYVAWRVRPIQPAIFNGAAQALITLVIAFGLNLTPEQVGALMGAVSLILGYVGVRPQVTPLSSGTHVAAR